MVERALRITVACGTATAAILGMWWELEAFFNVGRGSARDLAAVVASPPSPGWRS
jgi:hypothetical protein